MKTFFAFGAAALVIGAAFPATLGTDAAKAAVQGRTVAQSFGPRWFGPGSGGAAQQLVQLLATSQADGLNPKRYNVKGLSRAVAAAQGGDPAAAQRASAMLNSALLAYARDTRHDPNIGIIYIDRELRPTAAFGSRSCCPRPPPRPRWATMSPRWVG